MRALVLEEFGGPFIMKDVAIPAIGPHEALVRVRHVGICGTATSPAVAASSVAAPWAQTCWPSNRIWILVTLLALF